MFKIWLVLTAAVSLLVATTVELPLDGTRFGHIEDRRCEAVLWNPIGRPASVIGGLLQEQPHDWPPTHCIR